MAFGCHWIISFLYLTVRVEEHLSYISENPEEKAVKIVTEINKIEPSIRKAIIKGINAYEYGESYNVELVNFAKTIEEINNN